MWKAMVGFLLLLISVVPGGSHSRQIYIDGSLAVPSRDSPLPLDMAKISYDDQYTGCIHYMEKKIKTLLERELSQSDIFNEIWQEAKKEWKEKNICNESEDKTRYAVAMYAYSMNSDLYREFNNATRSAGKNEMAYRSYPFKSLHFLLTNAGMQNWTRKPRQQMVYRGVKHTFDVKAGERIRFGQFTSTSINQCIAEPFGMKTFFHINTTCGYEMGKMAKLSEEEVLIPPYEVFHVDSVNQRKRNNRVITLSSRGSCSYFNCVSEKGYRKREKACPTHKVLFF